VTARSRIVVGLALLLLLFQSAPALAECRMAPRVTRSGIFIPSLGSCDTQVELLLATSDNPGDLAFAKDTLKLFYWSGAAWFSFATASSISGTTNTLAKFLSTTTVGNSTITDDGTAVVVNGRSTFLASVTGASVGSNFLQVVGTFPSSLSAGAEGVRFDITPSGSSAQTVSAVTATLESGYTGASQTSAIRAVNSTHGTGNDPFGGGDSANYSIQGFISGSTASATHVGVGGAASNGGVTGTGIGVLGRAHSGKTAIGVVGVGLNGSTLSIGGFFGLYNSVPVFEQAGLIADNGDQASPIFIARDNGVTQFTLADGGNVVLGNVAGVAAPASRSISGEPGLGTDIAGADITTSSGVGTGAGSPSRFILLNPEVGASSSTAQTTIVAWDRTQKSYAMADATDVPIFTVILPTSNTACGSTIGFSYQATVGGNTVSHAAAVLYVFTNNGGTVSGIGTETGETLTGTGCGIGCDAYTVTVVGTTATAKANFDNSLGVTGALRWQLYNNTCQSYVRQ